MKINIGGKAYSGWATLDCYHKATYRIDLREKIVFPIENSSVEEYHCSHVLEHVDDSAVMFTLGEVLRTLVPGGLIRISVPDADRALSAYRHGSHAYFDRGEGRCVGPNLGRKFLNMFVSYKHRRYSGGPPVTDLEVDEHLTTLEEFVEWGVSLIPKEAHYIAHCNWFNAEKLRSMLSSFGEVQIPGPDHLLDKHPIISLRATAWKR